MFIRSFFILACALVLPVTANAQRTEEQEAFRAQLLREAETNAQAMKANSRDTLDAYQDAVPTDCHADAMLVEKMADSPEIGIGEQVRQVVQDVIPQKCDPGKTGSWMLVQRGHFAFHKDMFDSAYGQAAATVIQIPFSSVVSCVRGTVGINQTFASPYQIRSTCVNLKNGSLLTFR